MTLSLREWTSRGDAAPAAPHPPPPHRPSSAASAAAVGMMSAITMRLILLFSAVTAVCHGILPEIINSGISHILEEHPSAEETELERKFVDVEQLQEDPQRSEPEHPLLHVSRCTFNCTV